MSIQQISCVRMSIMGYDGVSMSIMDIMEGMSIHGRYRWSKNVNSWLVSECQFSRYLVFRYRWSKNDMTPGVKCQFMADICLCTELYGVRMSIHGRWSESTSRSC